MDAIRNVIVSNCIIKSSNRGIGIQNRDEGVVENIIFENIIIEGRLFNDVWWGKAEPIYITAYKRKAENHKDSNWRFAKGQLEGKVGEIKNISFFNIICSSENGVFVGGEANKISKIKFSDVKLLIEKSTQYTGGLYDLRPSDTVGILKTETAGFYFDSADEISLKNCSIKWGENKEPYFGNAGNFKNINSLEIKNFFGESANVNIEKFEIENCTNVTIT
jgi:hypothetical protein